MSVDLNSRPRFAASLRRAANPVQSAIFIATSMLDS